MLDSGHGTATVGYNSKAASAQRLSGRLRAGKPDAPIHEAAGTQTPAGNSVVPGHHSVDPRIQEIS
jgi:hypothetical protein